MPQGADANSALYPTRLLFEVIGKLGVKPRSIDNLELVTIVACLPVLLSPRGYSLHRQCCG